MKKLRKLQARLLSRVLPDQPVSRKFGFDLGSPVDRFYIEQFLARHQQLVRGETLEVGDTQYSRRFGGDRITRARSLHARPEDAVADIVGDLATGAGLPGGEMDCFIMTQTLPFIFDVAAAARHAVGVLRPGGHLLVTVPGITQISRYDMDRWGQFWSFTDLSLQRLFEAVVPADCVSVTTFGNVKAAAAFLYGLPSQALHRRVLEARDADYPLIIAAVIRHPGNPGS